MLYLREWRVPPSGSLIDAVILWLNCEIKPFPTRPLSWFKLVRADESAWWIIWASSSWQESQDKHRKKWEQVYQLWHKHEDEGGLQ